MRDEFSVRKNEKARDDPDDWQDELHVDLEGAGAGVDDGPPPLYADGDQGQHDDVAGQVLQHGQQVAHHLA